MLNLKAYRRKSRHLEAVESWIVFVCMCSILNRPSPVVSICMHMYAFWVAFVRTRKFRAFFGSLALSSFRLSASKWDQQDFLLFPHICFFPSPKPSLVPSLSIVRQNLWKLAKSSGAQHVHFPNFPRSTSGPANPSRWSDLHSPSVGPVDCRPRSLDPIAQAAAARPYRS